MGKREHRAGPTRRRTHRVGPRPVGGIDCPVERNGCGGGAGCRRGKRRGLSGGWRSSRSVRLIAAARLSRCGTVAVDAVARPDGGGSGRDDRGSRRSRPACCRAWIIGGGREANSLVGSCARETNCDARGCHRPPRADVWAGDGGRGLSRGTLERHRVGEDQERGEDGASGRKSEGSRVKPPGSSLREASEHQPERGDGEGSGDEELSRVHDTRTVPASWAGASTRRDSLSGSRGCPL